MNVDFLSTTDAVETLKYSVMTTGNRISATSINSISSKLDCIELLGVSFKILDFSDLADMALLNHLNTGFLDADVLDRISPTPVNPGVAVEFDKAGVLADYQDHHGKLSYTYSERLCYQYEPILQALYKNPNSRQLFMSIWDRQIDSNRLGIERVPCSIGYQLLERDGKLNMIYYMRSANVKDCLPNDIYTSYKLLEILAIQACVDPGWIQFMIGSLHYFEEGQPHE